MQDSNPSYVSQRSAAWSVSPMTSEATMNGELIVSTISPPPYTPSENMTVDSDAHSIGEKSPRDFKRPIEDDEDDEHHHHHQPASNYLAAMTLGSRASWMDLPEVVPESSFPEAVTPGSNSGAGPSTLPEVATAESSRGAVSTLPEVATGSQLELSTLPEAVQPSKMEMMSISDQALNTVTPLHMLGDEPDRIDCPFCYKQSMTEVKKKPSNRTHIQAVLLLFTTVCGAAAPYIGAWSFDIEHFCNMCEKKVAYRSRGKEIYVCKQPDSMKQVSKYSTGAEP